MRMYLWWRLCTLYLLEDLMFEDVSLVEFMYLVFTRGFDVRGCTSGGIYVYLVLTPGFDI